MVEQYRYDVFGAPTIADGNGNQLTSPSPVIGNRFTFTGREYTATFGIYEYRNRAYHPGLGRFMSEDPKGFVRRGGLGKEPSGWSFGSHPDQAELNLFRYCGNDPQDWTDPTGEIVGVDDAAEIYLAGAAVALTTQYLASPAGQKMLQQFGKAGDNLVRELGNILHSQRPRTKTGEGARQQEDVERAQEQAKRDRPSIKPGGNKDPDRDDWEGAKSRPKQEKLRDTSKSGQRARSEGYQESEPSSSRIPRPKPTEDKDPPPVQQPPGSGNGPVHP